MSNLPTGTVTFLFTDIESSTTRWEQQRAAMQQALARHDAIMRAAIEAHGGHVFKTVGDAFYAAFARAPDALAAALAAQRQLHAETWSTDIESLRVRIAVHTGAADERDGDYFGPPLNRVGRLLTAGHGGQILISHVTQELVRDQLPPGTQLRSLGEHRLRDLIRPEHVYQLVAPDLPSAFPALRTLENHPNNLPLQPTPFIGRERELEAVRRRLLQPEVRLLTLSGPGGTGKTRLALQAAADLLDDFADGVWFANLAPISDPRLVISSIVQSLGVTEVPNQPLLDTTKRFLRDKHLLLVLDNFEQVLAAAPLISDLLAGGSGLKVLVTSRAMLGLYGEHHVLIPPLALPDPQRLPPLERLSQYEAVRLFIERAQAVVADFTITNENAPAVAEICIRLDGLPLAIELAAARVRFLPPPALLQRLSSRLKMLTGGARDLPARQQTLRNAIDWSYGLLDTAEQMLFARLAVFVGGRTLEAIEAVCNVEGDLPVDPFEGVASLVDKNLLRQDVGPDGAARFVMLETIHEFAQERLEERREVEAISQRHADYFLQLALTGQYELRGAHQAIWLERLAAEHGNLRAALRWYIGQGQAEAGLSLAGALGYFWVRRGHMGEGREWLEQILSLPGASEPTRPRARALAVAGMLAGFQSDPAVASALVHESLALYRLLADREGLAVALRFAGIITYRQGDLRTAQSYLEQSTDVFRELGMSNEMAESLRLLAIVVHNLGDDARAASLLPVTDSVQLYREQGDRWGLAWALIVLGELARVRGDNKQADEFYAESLAIFREAHDKYGAAVVLGNQGHLALRSGDPLQAAALLRESLAVWQEMKNYRGVSVCLAGLAGAAAAQGQALAAARLCGAVEKVHESPGQSLDRAEREDFDRTVASLRAQLDEASLAAAWKEGRAMSLQQAVTYALEVAQSERPV